MTTNENMIPTIFNEIIRKRIADYIDKEVTEMIKKRVDSIISEVMGDLQVQADTFRDMQHYETKLVVKAIYNGQDIEQQPRESDNTCP